MSEIATTWQTAMQNAVTDSETLLQLLELNCEALTRPKFACKVPRSFIAKMEKGNPKDPLLLQVMPQVSELNIHPEYSDAPLSELEKSPIPGLIHKYHGRALLTITGACAVHCRYCFRQNTDYNKEHPGKNISQIIDYLQKNNSISEIILSGGDPLSLSDNKLANWLAQIATVDSIQRLRIHTRLPVVLPERITTQLVDILEQSRLWVTIVMHVNHPNELDHITKHRWQLLSKANIMLWNQSVLLNGINDNPEILMQLSHKLLEHNVVPYYLHQLDKVSGSEHFAVSDSRAITIFKELQAKCPGYFLPKLVADRGGPSKTIVTLE